MAPVERLHRLVWGGKLFESESWSCSLHFHSAATESGAADDYLPALQTWMSDGGAAISSAAHLDFVKFNIINPVTAKYAFPVSNSHEQANMSVGALAFGPGQDTVCVTTRTAIARGRGHAGRFYTPTGNLAITLGTDGRMAASSADGIADAAAILIRDLNLANPGITACVFSKVGQSQEPITGVSVGRVIDTMRSRRAQLLEEPQFSPLP